MISIFLLKSQKNIHLTHSASPFMCIHTPSRQAQPPFLSHLYTPLT